MKKSQRRQLAHLALRTLAAFSAITAASPAAAQGSAAPYPSRTITLIVPTQKAAEQGAAAEFMDPKRLGDYSKSELARWGEVVKASKIEGD